MCAHIILYIHIQTCTHTHTHVHTHTHPCTQATQIHTDRQTDSLWFPSSNSQHKVNSKGRYEVTEEVVDGVEEGRS